MNQNEYINQKYYDTYKRVEQEIKSSPFCIVAISGVTGGGKSDLSRYLSCRLDLSCLETDLFLRSGETKVGYDYAYIHGILEHRRKIKRNIIVDGCSLCPVLCWFERSETFLIHIENRRPSDRPKDELIDFENSETYSIKEMPNVENADLNPDSPSCLKACANYTIRW
jgi:hypothetical protein